MATIDINKVVCLLFSVVVAHKFCQYHNHDHVLLILTSPFLFVLVNSSPLLIISRFRSSHSNPQTVTFVPKIFLNSLHAVIFPAEFDCLAPFMLQMWVTTNA